MAARSEDYLPPCLSEGEEGIEVVLIKTKPRCKQHGIAVELCLPYAGVMPMSKSVSQLEQEARHLPTQDRALLAQHLIASIDPGEDVDAEAAWLEEAERRYQLYRQGKLTAKPADQVFREAKSQLT